MAETLAQVNAKIAKLQAKVDAARAKEVAAAVASIREAILRYGLTAQDLGFARGRGAKATGSGAPAVKVERRGPRAGAKKAALPIKYRDDAGNAWVGRGKPPNWYKEALASGKTPEDLAVK